MIEGPHFMESSHIVQFRARRRMHVDRPIKRYPTSQTLLMLEVLLPEKLMWRKPSTPEDSSRSTGPVTRDDPYFAYAFISRS